MKRRTRNYAPRDAILSGAVACAATLLTVMWCGARESGSAVAPVNASMHFLFGREAETNVDVDLRHTALGLLTNAAGCVFWATLYEKAFGAAARCGKTAAALLGGAAVAGLAYVTDYHIVPRRLSPGWEAHISSRSLLLAYAALALSLPLRGLARSRRQQ
ncbi:MAG TPA: hypothetical protein VFY39_14365 [Gammaproteobacteria bacterium]|nr:hypothetical protein [Gammaproteobacteria bacterium]